MRIPLSQTRQDPDVKRWSDFVENEQKGATEVPEPFPPVNTLVQKYLSKEPAGTALDIGCETGKNAVPLIQAGYKVMLLDIAPNAIAYTLENLGRLGLQDGVVESINSKIEALDPKYGPFKVVVGTYAFSFIPPDLFEEVMKKNVLGRVEPGGYFVGGFFGQKHSWANEPTLTIVSSEKLEELFASAGFSICEKEEKIREEKTLEGTRIFHTIRVIAKRELRFG